MAIEEKQNGRYLYDCTRPFAWVYQSVNAENLIYVIQKLNVLNNWVDISGFLRQPKEFASNTDFFINPAEILADEIDTQIRRTNETGDRVEWSGSIKFRLTMTEEAIGSNGVLEYDNVRANWYNSSFAYAIDAATQHEELNGLSQESFLDMCRIHGQTGQNRGKWLTNKPLNTTTMSVLDNEYIYTFIDVKKCTVQISLESETASLHTYSSPFLKYGLNNIPIGIPNIVQQISINVVNGFGGLSAIHRVRYVIKNAQSVEVSEKGSYIVDKSVCQTERLRVYWKNRKGGIDGYTFNSELSVELGAKSKVFKRVLGHRRNPSEDLGNIGYLLYNTYGSDTRTMGTINMVAQETIKVTSRFHRQDELRWLSEIITSPQVWIENLQTGNLNSVYSVTRKATTKPKGKSLGQMKLSIKMSNEVMTQR